MPAQGFVPVDLRLLVIKVMTHGWDLSKAMYLCVRACGRVCLLHVFLCIVVLGGGAFLVAQQIWHCVWGGKKKFLQVAYRKSALQSRHQKERRSG